MQLGEEWPIHKGSCSYAIGHSRGAFTSTIHYSANSRRRPVAFALKPGNVADISMALPLVSAVVPPRRPIADKACAAQSLRDWHKSYRLISTIPSIATVAVRYRLNQVTYRRRNRTERRLSHLENWRCVATHYERLAYGYLAAIVVISCVIADT